MVDDLKYLKDNIFKVLVTGLGAAADAVYDTEENDEDDVDNESRRRRGLDPRIARELINQVLSRAGKSKDEVVNIVAREIGQAVAAMLREPLTQLAKNQKLQITFELNPKSDGTTETKVTATRKEKTTTLKTDGRKRKTKSKKKTSRS